MCDCHGVQELSDLYTADLNGLDKIQLTSVEAYGGNVYNLM